MIIQVLFHEGTLVKSECKLFEKIKDDESILGFYGVRVSIYKTIIQKGT